jgi:hypothetical protein
MKRLYFYIKKFLFKIFLTICIKIRKKKAKES